MELLTTIVSGTFGLIKFGLCVAIVGAAAAYVTKPDEASGRRYIEQWITRERVKNPTRWEAFVGQKAVSAELQVYYQDCIVCRVASANPGDKQFVGLFGAWFPIK